MAKLPINHTKFQWQVPTQGVLYTVGWMNVPANAYWQIAKESPFTVLIPVYEEATADGSGNFSKELSHFTPSNYWAPEQLIYAYDVTNDQAVSFTYDANTNTVSGTAGASATVRIYYIPFDMELRIEAQFQTPEGRQQRTLWSGDQGSFIYMDQAEDKVRFERGVNLQRSDKLEIKVRTEDTDVPVNPFLPDGETLVPILKVRFRVEQMSTSIR